MDSDSNLSQFSIDKKSWPWIKETTPCISNENMCLPKISIVTPSFNQGRFIEETILSVINQNYPNLEYIVIDGGSTDNSIEVIKKYEKYLSYWISEKDNGQSHAINKGLEKCTGEIFNWLNSDDYLAEGALFNIAKTFLENNKPDVICGYCNIINEKKEVEEISRMYVGKSKEDTIVNYWINQPSSFYNLITLKKIGNIYESLYCVMDLELWFRYLLSKKEEELKIILTDNIISFFRKHPSSKTQSIINLFYQEIWKIENEILKLIKAPQILQKQKKVIEPFRLNWEGIFINKKRYISLYIYREINKIIKNSNSNKISFKAKIMWSYFLLFYSKEINFLNKIIFIIKRFKIVN
ncbi:MAG TPA: glycosyltransferase family 2 protein [Bacteroidales bacterium]|nr:glycosyltransferase family 2 protein [Bacteroidales bacterium]HPS15963.1 glycosyltransferase family 2 protein [Bacteroidales bacterium]